MDDFSDEEICAHQMLVQSSLFGCLTGLSPSSRLLSPELAQEDYPAGALDKLTALRRKHDAAQIGFVADALIAKLYILLERPDDALARIKSPVNEHRKERRHPRLPVSVARRTQT